MPGCARLDPRIQRPSAQRSALRAHRPCGCCPGHLYSISCTLRLGPWAFQAFPPAQGNSGISRGPRKPFGNDPRSVRVLGSYRLRTRAQARVQNRSAQKYPFHTTTSPNAVFLISEGAVQYLQRCNITAITIANTYALGSTATFISGYWISSYFSLTLLKHLLLLVQQKCPNANSCTALIANI